MTKHSIPSTRLYRLYQSVYDRMHSRSRPLKLYYHQSDKEMILGWVSSLTSDPTPLINCLSLSLRSHPRLSSMWYSVPVRQNPSSSPIQIDSCDGSRNTKTISSSFIPRSFNPPPFISIYLPIITVYCIIKSSKSTMQKKKWGVFFYFYCALPPTES